jgi:hypothetical protein
MMRPLKYLGVLGAVVAAPLAGQQPNVTVQTAVLAESYSFDDGLSFTRVSEQTVPVAVTVGLGRRAAFTVATGFARVDLKSADEGQLASQEISTALDTEFRLSVDVIPGRLVFLATGAAPTGSGTVALEELSVLGALSSDIIGFSATDLGTGGNLGGGFVGVVPVGRMALGIGATFQQSLTYDPVQGQTQNLRPGGEVRVRGGIEGALGPRTYLRVAGIFARRQKDQINGETRNGVGNRYVGYVSLNQAVGRSSVTVYGFDVFRSNPQVEATATGAALLPRGNLLAAGAQFALGLAPRTSVTPRVEFRTSSAAPDTSVTALQRLGSSVRFGVDFRHRVNRDVALVLEGNGLIGDVVQAGNTIDFRGYRAGVHLEITR